MLYLSSQLGCVSGMFFLVVQMRGLQDCSNTGTCGSVIFRLLKQMFSLVTVLFFGRTHCRGNPPKHPPLRALVSEKTILGVTSPVSPGILLSRKSLNTLGKCLVFEKNDG